MGNWGYFTPVSEVKTLLVTARGPPCRTGFGQVPSHVHSIENPAAQFLKSYETWDILNINWLAGFLNHQQYLIGGFNPSEKY